MTIAAVDIIAAIIKSLCLLAILQAVGVAVFAAIYRNEVHLAKAPANSTAMRSAWLGILLVVLQQSFGAARMAGDYSGLWDSELQHLSWFSGSGMAALLRILALLAIAIAVKQSLRRRRGLITASVLLLLASFSVSGHIAVHAQRIVLTVLIVTHIALIVYWLGAVRVLSIAANVESVQQVGQLAQRFSKHATFSVPCIALSGIAMLWILLPNVAALLQPYGLSLLAKSLGFLLLLLLAARNKWQMTPALQRGEIRARTIFLRVLRAEYLLLGLVIAIAAFMTTLFSP